MQVINNRIPETHCNNQIQPDLKGDSQGWGRRDLKIPDTYSNSKNFQMT